MLGVALLFLTHGFLPRSPGLPSVKKENDVEEHRRIFLARSHILCVRAYCKRVWGILPMCVPIKKRKCSCGKYLAASYISYSVITAYLEICQLYVGFISICLVYMLGSRATMSFPTTCSLRCKTFFSWDLLLMDNGKIPKYHTPIFQTVLFPMFPHHVGLY